MALSRIITSALSGLSAIATSGSAADLSGTLAKARLPAGSVLQVVQTLKTDTLILNSNSTATAVTGMSATITPSSTNSKILVLTHLNFGASGTTYGGWLRRNGTDIGIGDVGANQLRVSMGLALTSDTNQSNTFAFNYLDSPNSTSSLTYQLYVINDNTGALYVNRSVADSNGVTGKRGISTITLMEIAG
jgi:hypothetical protein